MTGGSDLIPTWVAGRLAPFDKLAAHREGLRHKAVSVFVMADDRILIQRRAMGKYHTPGLWANTCCTHPHWDETPEDCAHRRLREELGIEGLQLLHAGQVEYRADVGGGMIEHEVVDLFTARATATLPISANPDEVIETRWIATDDLRAKVRSAPEQFTPWLRIYLSEHAAMVLGN
ncbi:MAG: isopentenyl-diphosphate Delta-isomerase [Paracoccaceae bacterium]